MPANVERFPVDLGSGGDRFYGGPAAERVFDGSDSALDVIRTRAGDDDVRVGYTSRPTADRVYLGEGDDVLTNYSKDDSSRAVLVGGSGSDRLKFDTRGPRDAVLDNVAGTFTKSGQAPSLSWKDFERFYFTGPLSESEPTITIIGSDESEEFVTLMHLRKAELGGGDDRLNTYRFDDDASIDGQEGNDFVMFGGTSPSWW